MKMLPKSSLKILLLNFYSTQIGLLVKTFWKRIYALQQTFKISQNNYLANFAYTLVSVLKYANENDRIPATRVKMADNLIIVENNNC